MSKAVTKRNSAPIAPHLDYIVVDLSGSMYSKWTDTMRALDSYVATCQAARLNSHLIVRTFDGKWDGDSHEVVRDHAINAWVPFSEDPLGMPNGSSPLYDSINHMGRELRDLDPAEGVCSIMIVTDGDANGNQFTDEAQAKAILDWCRAKGWQVTFIGCDFNNSRQARLLGADDTNSIGVQKHLLSEAGKLLASKRIKYAQGGDMGFSDSEKQQFGGYLSGPSSK